MITRPKVKTAAKAPSLSSSRLLAEFRDYLQIDTEELNDAMAKQADLFFKIGEECSLAISRRDEAKENLNTVDADLGQSLRNTKKGDDKRTEGAVRDLIQTDTRHQEAFEKYNMARRDAAVLESLRDAFQERGRMLRDLGQLYAAGYFTVRSSKNAAADIGREQLRRARSERVVA